jgi:hypothetical protein
MPSRSIFDKKLKNYLEDGFSQALPGLNAIIAAAKMTLKMTRKTPSKMTPKSTKTPTPTETHQTRPGHGSTQNRQKIDPAQTHPWSRELART